MATKQISLINLKIQFKIKIYGFKTRVIKSIKE
jgi:hypothetical protein